MTSLLGTDLNFASNPHLNEIHKKRDIKKKFVGKLRQGNVRSLPSNKMENSSV